MNTAINHETVHRQLLSELRADLNIIYGMGVQNPDEPEMDKAIELAYKITSLWHMYWLIRSSGISTHLVSEVPVDEEVAAAVIAAFYSRVRAPTWVTHPECAANLVQARKTVAGRILMTAAQTLTQTLVASGFTGNFEGSPSEVAGVIRTYLGA